MVWVNAVIQGILTGGFYALFACGLSLLFGVMRIINLAHGDMAIIGAYVAVTLIPALHVPAVWAFLIVVPIFAVGGYVLQRTILQLSLDRGPFTVLLVTFGLSVIAENVLQLVFSANGQSINIGSLILDSFNPSTVISISYLSAIVLGVAVLVLAALQLFLSHAPMGRLIRAVADDSEAAQLAGVNYRHVFGVAAGIALGTVGLAGIAYGMFTEFFPTTGVTTLLFAFEAVVIGGVGSLWGTLVGAIVLGIAQQVGAQINPEWQLLAGNIVFLAVLALRPQGLFGIKELA